jgi:hypothetical protein
VLCFRLSSYCQLTRACLCLQSQSSMPSGSSSTIARRMECT